MYLYIIYMCVLQQREVSMSWSTLMSGLWSNRAKNRSKGLARTRMWSTARSSSGSDLSTRTRRQMSASTQRSGNNRWPERVKRTALLQQRTGKRDVFMEEFNVKIYILSFVACRFYIFVLSEDFCFCLYIYCTKKQKWHIFLFRISLIQFN